MKQSYKIPASLNTSYMDMTITITNNEGLGLRPLPMKQLSFFLIVLFSAFFFVTKTFVGQVSTGATIAFVGIYCGFCISALVEVCRVQNLKCDSYIKFDSGLPG